MRSAAEFVSIVVGESPLKRIAYLAALIAAFAADAVGATVIHVPEDYLTIQQALNAADADDVVVVGPGRYVENIVFPEVPVVLMSSHGPERTIVDGSQAGPVVFIGGSATRQTILSGFTITNGNGGGHGAGGVWVSGGRPIITGNLITGNAGSCQGGGVTLSFSAALLYRNVIADNDASSSGGGGGGGGGGIGIGGNPCPDFSCGAEIIGNRIVGNILDNCASGGGVFVNSGGRVRLIGNVIAGNSVTWSGGAFSAMNGTEALIENNLIVANRAGKSAGGLHLGTLTHLVNNTIVNNFSPDASAILLSEVPGNARIANNLVSGSGEAGGALIGCFYFNPAPLIPLFLSNNVYSENQATYGGRCPDQTGNLGNISEEPVYLSNDDFRLSPDSPGIDQGFNAVSGTGVDLLGADRIVDGDGDGVAHVDIGAYEFGDVLFVIGFEWDFPD